MKPPTDTDTLTAPVDTAAVENPAVGIDQTAGNFSYKVDYAFDAGTGLSEDTVRYISSVKKEAPWILEFRLAALKKFFAMPLAHPLGHEGSREYRFSKNPLLPFPGPEAQTHVG